jgi:hypothetical protein
MRIFIVGFLLLLLLLDANLPVNRLVARGVAQGIGLLIGMVWLLGSLSPQVLKRYRPIWAYLAILAFSSVVADASVFVLLQVASLAAVIIFSMAYFEGFPSNRPRDPDFVVHVLVFGMSILCVISIGAYFVAKGMAFEFTGGRMRFRGVLIEPATMGALAGSLLGLTWFGVRTLFIRLPMLGVALFCSALTGSRTFWIGAAAAILGTMWIYKPRMRKVVIGVTAMGVITVGSLIGAGFDLGGDKLSSSLRLDTVSNLTGRTDMWELAFEGYRSRPLLGYGFTLGAQSLTGVSSSDFGGVFKSGPDSEVVARSKLHSGYVQSLLDSGAVGFIFYLAALFIPVFAMMKHDQARQYPAVFFALLFLLVTNAAESIIHSAAGMRSIIFWMFAVFALSLRGRDSAPAAKVKQSRRPIRPLTNRAD